MTEKTYDEPSEVIAANGKVVVDGPDGVAVTLTPNAAEETSNRLFDRAAEARGQEIVRALGKRLVERKEFR